MRDSWTSLRVSQRSLSYQGGSREVCFYRLNMSIECASFFNNPVGAILPVASSPLSPGMYFRVNANLVIVIYVLIVTY